MMPASALTNPDSSGICHVQAARFAGYAR